MTYTKCERYGGDKVGFNEKEMGEKLVALRGNMTQEKVAKDLNISKSALAMYETGQRVPRDPVKIRIAAYYKKTVGYIFFGQKEHDM